MSVTQSLYRWMVKAAQYSCQHVPKVVIGPYPGTSQQICSICSKELNAEELKDAWGRVKDPCGEMTYLYPFGEEDPVVCVLSKNHQPADIHQRWDGWQWSSA